MNLQLNMDGFYFFWQLFFEKRDNAIFSRFLFSCFPVFIFSIYPCSLRAQDYHLSQFQSNPLYLNPALTGQNFSEKMNYRVASGYRTQWRALSNSPFRTGYISYEKANSKFNYGGLIFSNTAGKGNLGVLEIIGSASYRISEQPRQKHNLSVGFQAGLLQRSIRASSLSYDNQYSAGLGTFDQSIGTGENFGDLRKLSLDVNMGAYYENFDLSRKFNPHLGFGVFHVNKPIDSFTGGVSRTPIRFSVNSGGNLFLSKRINVQPEVLFMNQGISNELNIGGNVVYSIGDSSDYKLNLGLNYRNKDALIFQAGFGKGKYYFRMSYDYTLYFLNKPTGGRGAIEFSLIFKELFVENSKSMIE